MEVPAFIVEDSDERLVSYFAPGAPFRFPHGDWPTADGRHPWGHRRTWSGHGCLMVQRPGEHHAVWHFWDGPDRHFRCWYFNLQTAFRRTPTGYATQDLELDIVVAPDGSIAVKDDELLEDRITDGRYTPELVDWIRSYGRQLIEDIQENESPWDRSWANWTPPDDWHHPAFP